MQWGSRVLRSSSYARSMAVIGVLLAGAQTALGPAQAQTSPILQSLDPAPPSAPFTGSFSYDVPIEVPAFRGLEPKISLSYDSNRGLQVNGRDQGWLGLGWRLGGVSIIERSVAGRGAPDRGTPSFAAGSDDVYVLDGEELYPCAGLTAAAQARAPSCVNGGNYVTRVESYERIRYWPSLFKWEITAKDGTLYSYTRQGLFWPTTWDTTGQGDLYNYYRFLLTSVEDTNGNVVTYDYTCRDYALCLADTISYNGTQVKFYWETRPDLIRYAAGLGLAEIDRRLKSIGIRTSGALVRAYGLDYIERSSGDLLVWRVRQWGSDFSIETTTTNPNQSYGTVYGGTFLPHTVFNYPANAALFATASNFSFARNLVGRFQRGWQG